MNYACGRVCSQWVIVVEAPSTECRYTPSVGITSSRTQNDSLLPLFSLPSRISRSYTPPPRLTLVFPPVNKFLRQVSTRRLKMEWNMLVVLSVVNK